MNESSLRGVRFCEGRNLTERKIEVFVDAGRVIVSDRERFVHGTIDDRSVCSIVCFFFSTVVIGLAAWLRVRATENFLDFADVKR